MADLQRNTHPKARKRHTCEDCGRTIEPGETYSRNSFLWEGVFTAVAYCTECEDLQRDLYNLNPDEYFSEGEDGCTHWPYLAELEQWDEVRAISPEWAARADAYIARRQIVDPWYRTARP